MARYHRPHHTSPHFTSYQAASAAGISYRQLDYWTRIGLISPSKQAGGSGSRRRFSHRDVLLLAAAAELMRLGAGTEASERLVRWLDGLDIHAWPETVVVTLDSIEAGEGGSSGWYVDLVGAVRAANAELFSLQMEGVG